MLFLVDKYGCEWRWHVGKTFPCRDYEGSNIRVDFIQADGDELTFLKGLFPTLPFPTKPVVVITGEFAKYIYANLSSPERGE